MSKKANPKLIGGFVLGAIVLAVLGVTFFGSSGLLAEKQRYVLYFDGSVKGLNIGAPVMFRGVKIGTVVDISVHVRREDFTFRIPVVIEIETDRIEAVGQEQSSRFFDQFNQESSINMLIEKGLRAQLQIQSLVTGQLFVQLDMHPGTPVTLVGIKNTYKELPTIASGFQELTQTFEDIPLQEVTQKMISTLDGLQELVHSPDLAGSLFKLNKVLGELSVTTTHLNETLPELLQEMRTSFAAVRTAAERIDRQVDPVADDVRATAAAARETLVKTEQLIEQLQLATGEDSSLRYRLGKNLDELNKTLRSVRLLSETLERHPDALVRGKGLGGGE